MYLNKQNTVLHLESNDDFAPVINETEYSKFATEYYDEIRHPTCKNFRDASLIYLRKVLAALSSPGHILEVGAGRSAVAETLIELGLNDLRKLTLIDSSIEMLLHSAPFAKAGAHIAVGDTKLLPFPSKNFSMIVAVLGDPYNTPKFWSEVSRCLVLGGTCLFTTPSDEWVRAYRESRTEERRDRAYFLLADGRGVYVPSFIYCRESQRRMIESAGLSLVEEVDVPMRQLSGQTSPKLLPLLDGDLTPVRGYLTRKR
jgi:SAM-dependent methyltransferase